VIEIKKHKKLNTMTKTNNHLGGLINDVMNFGFDKLLRDDLGIPSFSHNPVNIVEKPDAYELEMIAPGREKTDFNIQLENGVLSISYQKKEQQEQEGQKTLRREFSLESFKRSFTLNEKVDATKIGAQYVNGVLKLVMPKKEEVKATPSNITVQ
jgi:HSP20 family protein